MKTTQLAYISAIAASLLLICFQQTDGADGNRFGTNYNSNNNNSNNPRGNSNLGPNLGVNRNVITQQLNQPMQSMYRSTGYQDRNDFTRMYQNVQMFQPISQFDYNSGATNSSTANVMVQVQLKNYVDQGLQLPNGQTCVCPSGFSCNYLGTTVPRCFFSFTLILSSPDSSVQYLSTDFVQLTSSGTIDLNSMTQEQQQSWQQPYTFYLSSKPSAIDVFVHHLGVVINAQTGELTYMQTVVHVDTFILSLNSVIPSVGNSYQSTQSVTLTGVILQTQLTLAYSVQCLGNLIGPNCDLSCNASTSNSAMAVCQSNVTNFFYTCNYMGSGQVQNCLACPWGIAQGSYCQNANGGVLNPSAAGVVPAGFRVATIVLGVLVGLLLILLLLVTIYSCVLVNRRAHEDSHASNRNSAAAAPGHNYQSTLRSEGNANRPLLQSTYNASQNEPSGPVPTAAPRFAPQLNAVPPKSSLRKTTPVPPAHLGGASSLNDTLNSTLSSVPLPPSKEADV